MCKMLSNLENDVGINSYCDFFQLIHFLLAKLGEVKFYKINKMIAKYKVIYIS